MLKAYNQSAATMNLLRAFARGGLADLHQVHKWTLGFVSESPLGQSKSKGACAVHTVSALEETMDRSLAPGGRPWDRAQDHRSLRTYFLQEVYEVIDAIDKDDMVNLKEELGDVPLQIVFHARLAEKEGFFTMQDVVDGINEKMIRRHPFVFEKITVEETKKALGDWETRKRLKNRKYLLSGVSKDLQVLQWC